MNDTTDTPNARNLKPAEARWLLVNEDGDTTSHYQVIEAEGHRVKLWNALSAQALDLKAGGPR